MRQPTSQHTGEAYKPDHYGKAIHIGRLPLCLSPLVEYMSRLVRLLLFWGDLYNLNPGAVPILYQLNITLDTTCSCLYPAATVN